MCSRLQNASKCTILKEKIQTPDRPTGRGYPVLAIGLLDWLAPGASHFRDVYTFPQNKRAHVTMTTPT